MSEEIYKRGRLLRSFKSAKVGVPKASGAPKYVAETPPAPTWNTLASRNKAVGEKKVRGARQPVKRVLDPPSALGTSQPTKAQPEWMRSYGSPGPKSFKD